MSLPNENLFSFKSGPAGQLFSFSKASAASKEIPKESPAQESASFNLKSEVATSAQTSAGTNTGGSEKLFSLRQEGPATANIFDESTATNKGQEQGDIMKSILGSDDNEVNKSILGPLPKIDTSLFIDEEYHAKQRLSLVKGTFATVCILGLFVCGYFYVQLSPEFDLLAEQFGQNVEQTLHAKTASLKNVQTTLNAKRYLVIKAHLDNFTYYADEYLKKYSQLSTTKDGGKKQALELQIADLRTKLKEDYDVIKEKLSQSNYVEVYRENEASEIETSSEEFNQLLITYFDEEKANLAGEESTMSELKELNETAALVGNLRFEGAFKGDFDSMTNEDLKKLVGDVNDSVRNELSILHSIMAKKVDWAGIIDEIEDITGEVDKFYGNGVFEDLGGIAYTGYDFDAESNRISITGQTKRDDATNFTLIANLIDKLEASTMFKDINMRSFTKSGSLDDGYVATLKLDFFLQGNDEMEASEKENPLEVPGEIGL